MLVKIMYVKNNRKSDYNESKTAFMLQFKLRLSSEEEQQYELSQMVPQACHIKKEFNLGGGKYPQACCSISFYALLKYKKRLLKMA